MKRSDDLVKTLIDQMFIIAGHELRYDDVIGRKDNWFQQYTMTETQRDEWKEWGISYIRKKKRWSKKLAEREMAFLDLYCGLKTA
jgi:hypothetical protein